MPSGSEAMDALKGAVVALAASLLVAVLFAYLFRVPIPMGGMIGPFGEFSAYGMTIGDVLKSVLVAWIFYGMFGGFIVLPLCGAVTGLLVGRKYATTHGKNKMIVSWSIIVSAIPVFVLSTLDYIIGPW
jgi:hypothetical protein